MIAAQKSTVGLAKPGPKIGSAEEPNYKPTLAEAGIDKKLSARAQKMAVLHGDGRAHGAPVIAGFRD